MALWIREAILVIGHNKYSLAGLDFSFEIPFEDSDEPPVATLSVTNLSPNTRAGIKRNDPVVLNAGYEGDIGCILIGKVVGLKHKQSNTDWTSTLTVQPCADEILNSLVNKTYAENTVASAMIRDPRKGLPGKNEAGTYGNHCKRMPKQVYYPAYGTGIHNEI